MMRCAGRCTGSVGDGPGREFDSNRATTTTLVLVAGVVFLVTFLAFSGALQNGFVSLDTADYVINNPHIRSFDWDNLSWMFTKPYASNWHPLTWLSHAVDYALYGLKPSGHHLTSILIHALNAAVLFILLFLLLRKEYESNIYVITGAGLAALLFGVHPQRVESVAWVAERKDVLCLFFAILTLIFYTCFAQSTHGRARWRWMSASFLAFGLALMSKPMAIMLPIVLLILDVYPLRRIVISPKFVLRSDMRSLVTIVLEKVPFVVLSLFSAVLTMWAQKSGEAVLSTGIIGEGYRVLNATAAILLYLYKLLIPVRLSLNYPIIPLPQVRSLAGFCAAVIVFFVIFFLAVREWRAGRAYWLVAWLIFLITLIPVIGIVFVGHAGAADRYTYLPTIPFFGIVGYFMAGRIMARYGRYTNVIRGSFVFLVLVLVGCSTWLTTERVKVWRSDVSLWEDVVALYPNNPNNLYPLGLAYQGEGDFYRAIDVYQRAIGLQSVGTTVREIHQFASDRKTSVYVYLYVKLAQCYEEVHDYKNALRVYQLILDNRVPIGVSETLIRRRLARLYVLTGQVSKAREVYPLFKDRKDMGEASAPKGREEGSITPVP